MDKAYSINMNQDIPTELNDAFTELLNETKDYNDKWQSYYQEIDNNLLSITC